MAILGIDEVGRGPWAGPLVIGACILPKDEAGNYPDWVAPLTDSKKLSTKKREEFSEIILQNALATGLGWVSAKEIDELGLSRSLRLATRRAVEEIRKTKVPFSEIIIDGTINFLKDTSLENYVTNLKKADLLIKEVSAASIIAKVARDHYMKELAEKYPGYGFESHVGYGTAEHKNALTKLGPCPEHRFSFGPISTFGSRKDIPSDLSELKNEHATTKQLGDRAENIVAEYLIRHDHNIISRNHKTKLYEIDIVSTKDDKIYFTEVKYRRNEYRGSSLDMITKDKLRQMTFAAEAYLKYYQELKEEFSPLLAVGLVSGPDFTFNDWFTIE
ncbi:ribonuclease HII [Candidatus Saccharibacteria bacterium]|nr:ribonuclease HII [Candidatus Saccharibacteria bacterium]